MERIRIMLDLVRGILYGLAGAFVWRAYDNPDIYTFIFAGTFVGLAIHVATDHDVLDRL